ncbi:MAG: phosphatidylinositol mannoside acyltransferase [Actinomycetota bacterium]
MSDAREGTSETWKQKVAYYSYASLGMLARVPPRPVARSLFRNGSRLAHATLRGSRRIVAENLSHVLGLPPDSEQVRAAVAEAFQLYGRYWVDAFRAVDEPVDWFMRRFRLEGKEHLDRALAAGNGLVGAVPHIGNWDTTGRGLFELGYKIVAVAEALEPPRLLDLFIEHRARLGMKVIPLVKGSGVGRQLADHLKDNYIVCLVADRDLSGSGIEVEMFGATRRMPPGPAMLALRTGAPLLICPLYTTEDGWVMQVNPPLEIERTGDDRADVIAATKEVAKGFERAIAAKPTDWHMFQPAWP